jgi:hypothetical protein
VHEQIAARKAIMNSSEKLARSAKESPQAEQDRLQGRQVPTTKWFTDRIDELRSYEAIWRT